jgi:23S rRNA (cytidine1920-2'-O)/16S rRNA (cytidine1409-2'-O)-methyltransferase
VTLIKPQFEAGKEQVERGGVVRDPEIHQVVINRIRQFGEQEQGLIWLDMCTSPLRGPAGNIEFLSYWEKPE